MSNRLIVAAAISIAGTAFAGPSGHAASGLTVSGQDFCTIVQERLEGTRLPSTNVIHETYESFKESKAEAQPLRTEQFVLYEDEANRINPLRISCKTKTGDLLNELYGEGSATGSTTCKAIHGMMIEAVSEGFSEDERQGLKIPAERIVLEDDQVVFMGSQWVEPFAYAFAGDGGVLHLKSKALLVEWGNLMFKMAPDRFRGTHYCHLIAPEYLRRLMLGDAHIPSQAK